MKKLSRILFFLICCFPFVLFGQKLNAKITVQADRLEPTYQNALQNLASDLEQYINNYDYSDNTYNTVIPFIMQIYVQQTNDTGSDVTFSSQVLVTNGTDQRYFDKQWEFPYTNGQTFQHGIYTPITSVVDFYSYLLLAGEVDKYGKLSGTPYYNSAQDVANQGNKSSYGGWRSRFNRLDDLQNQRELRLLKYTFFDAYWDFQESNVRDAKIGFETSMDLLRKIFNHNEDDKYTKIFLDGQAEKFAWLAKQLKNRVALTNLISMDPDNKDIYQSYLQ